MCCAILDEKQPIVLDRTSTVWVERFFATVGWLQRDGGIESATRLVDRQRLPCASRPSIAMDDQLAPLDERIAIEVHHERGADPFLFLRHVFVYWHTLGRSDAKEIAARLLVAIGLFEATVVACRDDAYLTIHKIQRVVLTGLG